MEILAIIAPYAFGWCVIWMLLLPWLIYRTVTRMYAENLEGKNESGR